MANDVNIKISIDSKTAESNVKNLGALGTKTARDIEIGFTSVTSAFKVFQGVLSANIATAALGQLASGYSKLVSIGGDAINEAVAQEKATSSLAAAMKSANNFTNKALAEMRDYANALSLSTVYTDDQIESSLKLAETFGLTNKQVREVLDAAKELSAAKGIGLEESVIALSKSLEGSLGLLGKNIPAIKNYTEAQLRNGDALKYVNSHYSGQAAAEIETYGGKVLMAKKAWGEMLESVGMIIIQNPDVLKSIKSFTDSIAKLTVYIVDNSSAISSFISDNISLLKKEFTDLDIIIRDFFNPMLNIKKAFTDNDYIKQYVKDVFSARDETTKFSEALAITASVSLFLTNRFLALSIAVNVLAAGVAIALAGLIYYSEEWTKAITGTSKSFSELIEYFGEHNKLTLFVNGVQALISVLSGSESAIRDINKRNEEFKAPSIEIKNYKSELDKANDSLMTMLGLNKSFPLQTKVNGTNISGRSEEEINVDQEKSNAAAKLQIKREQHRAEIALAKEASDMIALNENEAREIRNLEASVAQDELYASDLQKQEAYMRAKSDIESKYQAERYKIESKQDKDDIKRITSKNKFDIDQNKKNLEQEKMFNAQRVDAHYKVMQAQMDGAFAVANAIVAAGNYGAGTALIITKTVAAAQCIMNGYVASMMALAQMGPIIGAVPAATMVTLGYVNAAAVMAVGAIQLNAGAGKKGGYESGGIIPGSSFTGDRISANVNSGEMILNKQQQTTLFNQINSGKSSDNSSLLDSINRLADRAISIVIDGKEIAKAVRNQVNDGFILRTA